MNSSECVMILSNEVISTILMYFQSTPPNEADQHSHTLRGQSNIGVLHNETEGGKLYAYEMEQIQAQKYP